MRLFGTAQRKMKTSVPGTKPRVVIELLMYAVSEERLNSVCSEIRKICSSSYRYHEKSLPSISTIEPATHRLLGEELEENDKSLVVKDGVYHSADEVELESMSSMSSDYTLVSEADKETEKHRTVATDDVNDMRKTMRIDVYSIDSQTEHGVEVNMLPDSHGWDVIVKAFEEANRFMVNTMDISYAAVLERNGRLAEVTGGVQMLNHNDVLFVRFSPK